MTTDSAEDAWQTLGAELAEQIPTLEDRDTLILSHGDRYVQWRQSPNLLSIQAVSNDFLPPDDQIGAEGTARLTELGWKPPSPPGRHNWWIDQPWPPTSENVATIAELLVATLRDVFGVPHPSTITRESFNG